MANDLTRESDRLIRESEALVRDNREGGRHRRALAQPIGRGSAQPPRLILVDYRPKGRVRKTICIVGKGGRACRGGSAACP